MAKVITAEQAAELFKDGMNVAWTTTGLCGFCEEVAIAVEKRFLETGHPRNLFNTHSSGCGDHKERGMNHMGHEGMVRKHIAGHIGEAPKLGQLVTENKIECHLFPQGVMVHLYRQMAGKKVGVITEVGLGTYADPRQQGGKQNEVTKDDMVELITIDGKEYLHYKTWPLDMCIIRGSFADERGNITMDTECMILEAFHMATAVKNNGGIVIAQVEHLAKSFTLHPKRVKVPGPLVDYIVLAKPQNHLQTRVTYYDPALCGDSRKPLDSLQPMPLDERKIVARRAAMELRPNAVVNMGIGMADGVAAVAAEEGVTDYMFLTTELGNFGGMPAKAGDFPASWNSEACVDHGYMFDFYDGGGLDLCFLGLAQADKKGNLNVHKFGPKVVGPGGFVNISSTAKKVIFCGTLTASGDEYEFPGDTVKVVKNGKINKFVDHVTQITFSGEYATKRGQKVLYVTERAVFTLENGEMTLIEIAPGMDVEKDVIAYMDFRPRVSPNLKEMPKEIFAPSWGKLKDMVLAKA